MLVALPWLYDDGGRTAAGFKGDAGDCIVRAIAIAASLPYRHVYDELALRHAAKGGPRSARHGVPRRVYDPYFLALGAAWMPLMRIGSGCEVHLAHGELPAGRLVARLSGHMAAVINGVVRDNHDPTRDGTRCVYGYWRFP